VKRRAKIVCTLGPATHSYEGVRGLVYAGMDVARLNFSHGAHEQHREAYLWVREASDESGRGVGVLADLQGPKIRLGLFADGPVLWATGETVTITTDPVAHTTGPAAKVPRRIFGPWRSASTPTPRPDSSLAWRTHR